MSKEENLSEGIEELFLERSSNFYSGVGGIHPIVEAIIALIKSQISDEEAIKRLLSSDKESIKSIFVIDSILERLKEDEQKTQLRQMLSSGNSLDDITERGALYLSENKRTSEGDVLYRIDEIPERQRRDLLGKIRKVRKNYPHGIYIKKDISSYLDRNAEKFRKNRIIKYSVIGTLTLGTLIGGYLLNKNYDFKTEKQQETNISNSEAK